MSFLDDLWGTVGPGAIGGLFGGMFGGGDDYKDPTQGANRYLDQISQMLPGYYDPWIQAGKRGLGKAEGQYDWLMNDPAGAYGKFAGGYQESPGFQKQLQQALQGSNQAAAAGGMAGSPMAQQWGADIAQTMTSRDFENYMNRVLGMYGTGLQGQEGLSKTGFLASSGLGENLANVLGSKAGLSYEGEAGRNRFQTGQKANMMGGLAAIAQFLPYFL